MLFNPLFDLHYVHIFIRFIAITNFVNRFSNPLVGSSPIFFGINRNLSSLEIAVLLILTFLDYVDTRESHSPTFSVIA